MASKSGNGQISMPVGSDGRRRARQATAAVLLGLALWSAACGSTRSEQGEANDADGDGRPNTPAADNWDCDDHDSSVWRQMCQDSDDDGWCEFETAACLGAVVPAGYIDVGARTSGGQPDCDDSDSSVQALVHPDADGDGDSNHDPALALCVPEDQVPQGYSLYATADCDDSDPSRHDEAVEQWWDGIDSNCDGEDDPIDCNEYPWHCHCNILAAYSYELDESCQEQPDLFVVDTFDCQCLQPYIYYVMVGNRGGVAFDGEVEVVVSRGLETEPVVESFPISMTLDPLSTWPIAIEARAYERQVSVQLLTGDESECDATNNDVTMVEPERYFCP